jgi:DNA-binding NarL/FixJ family response regulator
LPLDASGDAADGAALVSLPQAGRTQDLAVHSFARQYRFSPAESEVLQALLGGRRPGDIARAKGVQLSTVRTQIGQLRLKCGAHSIRELLDRVAALPPMMALVQ